MNIITINDFTNISSATRFRLSMIPADIRLDQTHTDKQEISHVDKENHEHSRWPHGGGQAELNQE